jgi:hypothetical protein
MTDVSLDIADEPLSLAGKISKFAARNDRHVTALCFQLCYHCQRTLGYGDYVTGVEVEPTDTLKNYGQPIILELDGQWVDSDHDEATPICPFTVTTLEFYHADCAAKMARAAGKFIDDICGGL